MLSKDLQIIAFCFSVRFTWHPNFFFGIRVVVKYTITRTVSVLRHTKNVSLFSWVGQKLT